MRAERPSLRLIAKATGGSSGVPLQFDLDTGSNERRMAAWHRGYAWAGAEPGTKQLYLWGVPLGQQTTWQRGKNALYNWVYRRRILNSFEWNERRAGEFLASLNGYRPDALVAYTNPLYTLARWLDAHRLTPYSPRSIVIGAEKLHDFQRELIESVFQAPVFETYGSREFMLIGAECDRHEGLHLTQENLLIEVLEDDGSATPPGEEGNVVVTDLYNYGMPFVRYVTGDRATAGWRMCSCGRGLPLLTNVVGRRLDMLETPEGRQVPGEFFPHLLKEFPAIRQFQVVQAERDRIELRAVFNGDWTESERCRLEEEVRHVVGTCVQFVIVAVDEIPLTPAGKLRVVVNCCGDQRDADLSCAPTQSSET
jgi:phenylacetate-CoA ligase